MKNTNRKACLANKMRDLPSSYDHWVTRYGILATSALLSKNARFSQYCWSDGYTLYQPLIRKWVLPIK